MQTTKELFPISLILDQKPCLVVGGGVIAERKTKKLLLTGAKLTIISPDSSVFIQEKAKLQALTFIQREFIKTDIRGFSLVFAATDSKETNKKIIKECNKKGILCCAVDKNWENGSFITPASFSKESFTISVSSNGKKCKDSKKIKNFLKSALDKNNDHKLFKA
ncbi:MAG: bifunctional precorrin-2 dehydrogenase/sirohydrochlorin ferrochelatase [Lentisphaerota bacterium]